jgi:hypothetical protein
VTDDEIMKLVNSILGGCSGRDYYDYLCEQHWYGTREDMLELVRAALASDQGAAVGEPNELPCVHADNPKACYRVRCQLGNKCVDDDMSFRAKGAPAAAQPSKP